jgi:uncharacterized repeat protein (TIGR03803 family)
MTKTKLSRDWVLQIGLQTARAGWALLILLAMAAAVTQPATAKKFTVLHLFEGTPDGEFPEAPLVQDAEGNLYGTTTSGGGDNGTVFKVDKNGNESVLFSFNGSDGGFPTSGLTLDTAGNLYGVAEEGPGGAGVVFRLDKNGNENILHVFQGGFNREPKGPAGSLIIDEAGNLYGATEAGGQGPFPGFGALYRLDPTGNFTVLYEFRGKSDGSNPQGPLVRDAHGNLYGVATAVDSGGTIKGTVFWARAWRKVYCPAYLYRRSGRKRTARWPADGQRGQSLRQCDQGRRRRRRNRVRNHEKRKLHAAV